MNKNSANNQFIEGPIVKTLILTSIAMIPGTLAMSLYNIVDTYFVSRLGNDALAAMGYCFPVIMFVSCIYHGFTTGIMTLLSHAIGKKDDAEKSRILALGILLVSVISVTVGLVGASVIRPIMSNFVETPNVLDLTCQFMGIWFLGNFTISLGLLSNKLLLALGYTRQASLWMVLGILINVGLEPLFIFGLGPFPALGMYGAALATVIAQAITPIGSLYVVQKRSPFMNKTGFDLSHIPECWKRLALFSIPATLSMLILPIGGLVMTWIASHFGDVTVAGIAAAQRLETLAFIIPMSLGVSLSPMIAQNYAAHNFERVNEIRKFSMKFALCFLTIAAVIMMFLAEKMVGIFAEEPETLRIGTTCLQIVVWSFAGQEIFRFSSFIYNSCNRPIKSAIYNLMRMFCLAIPLSMIAYWTENVNWLFYGRVIADLTSALIIWYMSRRLVASFLKNGRDIQFETEENTVTAEK